MLMIRGCTFKAVLVNMTHTFFNKNISTVELEIK